MSHLCDDLVELVLGGAAGVGDSFAEWPAPGGTPVPAGPSGRGARWLGDRDRPHVVVLDEQPAAGPQRPGGAGDGTARTRVRTRRGRWLIILSRHTVRDHIKAIFAKVDVSSRGKLVAKLFAEFDEPTHLTRGE